MDSIKERFLASSAVMVTGRLLKLHFIYAKSISRVIEDKAFLASLISSLLIVSMN